MNVVAEKRKCKGLRLFRNGYCDVSTKCFNLAFVVSYRATYHICFCEDIPYPHQNRVEELEKTTLPDITTCSAIESEERQAVQL